MKLASPIKEIAFLAVQCACLPPSFLCSLSATTPTFDSCFSFPFPVLSQWPRICHWLRWCHLPAVWPASRPGAHDVLPWQHHLWNHIRSLLKERPPLVGRLWRLQLQCLGYPQGRTSRLVDVPTWRGKGSFAVTPGGSLGEALQLKNHYRHSKEVA